MVAVGVGHQDVANGLAFERRHQMRDMGRVGGSRIDHRDLATAHDIAAGSREREGTAVVGDEAAHEAGQLVHLLGLCRERTVERDVLGGQGRPASHIVTARCKQRLLGR